MDWYGNRYSETFTYTRVSWEGWNEFESYDYITDGSLEISSSSSLKVTGSFTFEGLELPRTDDLIRVYYSFVDSQGEYDQVALATLFVSYSSLVYSDTTDGMKSKGTLNGQSVLVVLENDVYGPPYTVSKGANPILEAVKIIEDCGLNVEYDPCGKSMSIDYTFNAGTSYLEIINWLCDFAGYYQAYPDAYGTLQLRQIKSEIDPVIEFANDDNSIMYPEVDNETNLNEACNVVKMGYSSASTYLFVEVRNDTGSPISLDQTGGRKSVLFEEASDIEEGTNALVSIQTQAIELLKDQAMKVETVKFSHAYVPMNINEYIGIQYSDFDWTGYIDSMSISLKPSIKTQTSVKKEDTYDISVSVTTGATEVDDG